MLGTSSCQHKDKGSESDRQSPHGTTTKRTVKLIIDTTFITDQPFPFVVNMARE